MRRWVVVAAGAAGLIGLLPNPSQAQTPLTVPLERQQQNALEANRQVLHKEQEGRFSHQLELEQTSLEPARRARESFLYQDNTEQRSLEARLREDAIRINQEDQANRERDAKQRLEELQSLEDARRRQGQ
jgi:hypothetical protein